MFEQVGHIPAPVTRRTWLLSATVSGFRVKDVRMGLWNILPQLRKAAESRCVVWGTLHGGPERPVCVVVKRNHGFCGDILCTPIKLA